MKLGFLFLWFAIVVAGCSASTTHNPDAGKPDVFVPVEASSDADASGPMCPADVSDYTPEIMHPPNPPHAGACTAQQAADYAACEGGDTSKCAQFGTGQSAQGCGTCIETSKTDKTWGVVVFDGSIGVVNVEGCVDDALNQVAYEKANADTGSCGDLLHASYGCQDAACGACTGDAVVTCDENVIGVLDGGNAECASYAVAIDPIDGSVSKCYPLENDAAPPALASCFPDTTITDITAQRADFLTRIAKYMCGS